MNEFWRKLTDEVGFNDYIASFADPARQIATIDTYSYAIDNNPALGTTIISATVTLTANVTMDGDADFVLCYFSGFGRKSSGNPSDFIINPALLIQIKNQATGRNFFNTASPMPMIAGQMGFPFLLSSPPVIKPRSTLTVSAVSALPASWTGFQFAMHGARIFYAG